MAQVRRGRFALAVAAAAAPAWAALLGLVLADALSRPAALAAALAATALAALIVRPLLDDLAALAAQAEEIAAAEPAGRAKRAGRIWLSADAALAIARARRRIAAAHRAAEARADAADAVVDGVPEPLLILDGRRRVVRANPAAEALLGGEILGHDLTAALRLPAILDAVAGTARDGRSRAVEVALALPVERHMRVRIARLPRWHDGDAIIMTLEDQTSIRRSEQMRVDFVANVSHELRTPLATLLGFVETLQGPARDDAEARERFLGIMRQQAARMQRIVEDLLSLSRIEAEEHNAPTGPVDLGGLLRSLADSLEPAAGRRGMSILLDCPADLLPVAGDAGQLAQLFGNLVENAIRYARPGTPIEITARMEPGAGPGRPPRVAVAVRDHGEGIPREHLPRLTERFYRVDAARSRDLGGTGLGLAIVKHIASRHRGTLAIESAPGEGSRFAVTLPVHGAADALASEAVTEL